MNIKPSTVLTFGILALAFSCTIYLSFLSIVFGAIGLSKAGNYVAAYGPNSGQVKAGKIMSIIGLILGIIMTIVAVVAIIGMASNY